MKVILFGATGMVGQGVLLECLRAKDVTEIVAVGRSAPAQQDPRLRTLQVPDMALADLSSLQDFDACFYCLGASSSGKTEAAYTLMKPIFPLMRKLFPKYILTTTLIGEAMLNAARYGYVRPILEIQDIAKLATVRG